jgi:hypothetical protein
MAKIAKEKVLATFKIISNEKRDMHNWNVMYKF